VSSRRLHEASLRSRRLAFRNCRGLVLPQLTTGKPPPRKKVEREVGGRGIRERKVQKRAEKCAFQSASVVASRGRLGRPPFERRACASCRLQGGAGCAPAGGRTETRARGPDGSRMRSPQLARCSHDQLRRRMGQHGAALARSRGGGCEVYFIQTAFIQSAAELACLLGPMGPRAGDPCSPS